ncbi:hypothetical protein [Aliarcobacter butzleri]|uniref:hypothetical protein n=1 Tax=Aliarcobacter butzleri TaxID=28197 RepID=UPI0021B4E6A8|nr:hypothetical protein [Aliarcobacter butzleri]MCT7587531.1 hypothetical protein [Aliarcobacter butzleri]
MSLDKKLNKLESKGEEKKINLRMPKGKADVLEILAEHYGVTVSTLIREMIDNSLTQLQKELVVVNEGLGIKIENKYGKHEVRYLPDIIGILAPNIELSSYGNEDFKTLDELDNFSIEHARLSVEFGLSEESHGISSISKKEYSFKKNHKKD